MKKAYKLARNYHASISQVNVRYQDEEQNVLIANSEGKFVENRDMSVNPEEEGLSYKSPQIWNSLL